MKMYFPVADPDPQIKGGGGGHPDPEIRGGGQSSKKVFLALWASLWAKNKGNCWAPWAQPWIHHCFHSSLGGGK